MDNINNTQDIFQQFETITEVPLEQMQRSFISWFEERGIVTDIRTQLRHHLVDIFKDTTIGKPLTEKQKKDVSPKVQAINLLIAELLLKKQFFFSLSTFSSEAPFLNALPDYLVPLPPNCSIPGPSNAEFTVSNFTEQNFWDILQRLGFSSDSIYSKKLYQIYFDNNQEPLLTCMILLLSKISSNSLDFREDFKDNLISEDMLSNSKDSWLYDIYTLLSHFGVPDEIILKLHAYFRRLFEKEQAKIRTEETTKFNFLHTQIQKDFQTREASICEMINEIETTFYKEKQKLTDELLKEQEKMMQMKKELMDKQYECDTKLETLHRKEERLKQRESELLEQTEMLKSRMQIMQNLYETIQKENALAISFRHQKNLEKDQEKMDNTVHLYHECDRLRKEIHDTKDVIKKFSQSLHEDSSKEKTQTECEEKLLKGLLERVQAENMKLRMLNSQQQVRLDELAVQNSTLISDLEISQTTINNLTRNRRTITVPPLLAPPSPPTNIQRNTETTNGGGEYLGFVPQRPVQPAYRHLAYTPTNRDSRRKIPKRLLLHNNDTSEDSPTDEILREAKHRLRKLEEETEEVDRGYRQFKQRHLKSIRDNLIALSPRNYSTLEQTRTSFDSKNSRDCHTTAPESKETSNKNYVWHDFQIPSTSKCTNSYRFRINIPSPTQTHRDEATPSTSHDYGKHYTKQTERNAETNLISRNHNSSSPEPSNNILHLQNLSLSSIDLSSESSDFYGKSTEKKL